VHEVAPLMITDTVVDVVDAAGGGLVVQLVEDEGADPGLLAIGRDGKEDLGVTAPRGVEPPVPDDLVVGVPDSPPIAGQSLTVLEPQDEGALGCGR